MKMYFSDTEIAFAPMMAPEISYWLGEGYTIFTHRNQMWMRIRHHKGHRVMIHVPDSELARVNTRFYTNTKGIIKRNEDVYRSAGRVS